MSSSPVETEKIRRFLYCASYPSLARRLLRESYVVLRREDLSSTTPGIASSWRRSAVSALCAYAAARVSGRLLRRVRESTHLDRTVRAKNPPSAEHFHIPPPPRSFLLRFPCVRSQISGRFSHSKSLATASLCFTSANCYCSFGRSE